MNIENGKILAFLLGLGLGLSVIGLPLTIVGMLVLPKALSIGIVLTETGFMLAILALAGFALEIAHTP